MMDGDLRKTAIITGSATGVGAATALGFAKIGYNVVINYSKSEVEAKLVQASCRDFGVDALLVQGDVANDSDCRNLVEETIKRWGRLDVLVNNAGITSFVKNSDEVNVEMFHEIFGVNTIGAFHMIRASVPFIRKQKGAIINVSSIAGFLGMGSSVPYIASKGALNAITLHFARELAPEVRVNAVCPGLITSRWFVDGIGVSAYEQLKLSYESEAPLKAACSCDDVADAVIWLANGAKKTTGEILLLDSGIHLA